MFDTMFAWTRPRIISIFGNFLLPERKVQMIPLRLSAFGWLLATCLAVVVSTSARADDALAYPQRPVKIQVGYAPGGPTDVVARLIADELTRDLGQPFIVENKAGASGHIATQAVVRSPPDGYTLLVMTTTDTISMSMYKNLDYNVNKDLKAIAQLTDSPNVLVTSPKSQIDSLQTLIREAKTHPGTLTYASTGVGSTPNLAGELFKARAGIDMVHVPYKGSSLVLADLISGQVSISFLTAMGSVKAMQTGQIRPLAVPYDSRLPALPDVPTTAEAGLPDFVSSSWFGLAAPAGTPKPIVDKLAAAVKRILEKPAVQERIDNLGGVAVLRGPQEFSAYIQAETDKWAQVVKAGHISAD